MQFNLHQKIFSAVIFLLAALVAKGQSGTVFTLEKCYQLANKNSPLYQQKALTEVAGKMKEKNLRLNWLPQVDLNAQATFQSAVTNLPVKIPNVTIEELDRSQYKTAIELTQPLFDGNVTAAQKKLQQNSTRLEAQQVEIDLYQLRTVINNHYFTALLMEQNIRVTELVQEDLNNGIKTISAMVANGVATKSNEDLLKAELLKAGQQIIEFKAARTQCLQGLSILTNTEIPDDSRLVQPLPLTFTADTISGRPEVTFFELQQRAIQLQSRLIAARTNPRVSFFANGGYGKPGLNQLKNEPDLFYITGLRLQVPIMSRFTQSRERSVLKVQEQVIAKQKENFLVNNKRQSIQQKNDYG